MKGVAILKDKIYRQTKPKRVLDNFMNGRMFVELADSYVQALNQGEVPHLQSAWNNVCTSNCENSIRECLKMFEGRVSSEVQLPMGEGRLRDIL